MPVGLAIAPQLVIPKPDEQSVRCAYCKSLYWKLHTKRFASGYRITEMVCGGCQRQHKFDDAGIVQAGTKVDMRVSPFIAKHGDPNPGESP